jgi:hypothetical protein
MFLVINNISKRNNARDLCCSALAHGFTCLFVGGFSIEGSLSKLIKDSHHLRPTLELSLSRAIEQGLQCIRFDSLRECKTFLDAEGVPLLGIEIMQVTTNY